MVDGNVVDLTDKVKSMNISMNRLISMLIVRSCREKTEKITVFIEKFCIMDQNVYQSDRYSWKSLDRKKTVKGKLVARQFEKQSFN